MDEAALIFLLFLCGWASASSSYKTEKSSYFRHPGISLDRRSGSKSITIGSPTSQQDSWLNHYYHGSNSGKREISYTLESPEELQWLIENFLDEQTAAESDDPLRYAQDDNGKIPTLKLDSLYSDSDDLSESVRVPDYIYTYDVDPPVIEDTPEAEFQKLLREVLSQQIQQNEKAAEMTTSKKPETKSSATVEQRPSSISTDSSLPITTDAISSTTESTTDVNAASNFMPPAASSKGQKEYPMLRPANENRRKFDQWAESLQKNMVKEAQQKFKVSGHKVRKDYPVDSLTEQLNKLKIHDHRVSKKSRPMWF